MSFIPQPQQANAANANKNVPAVASGPAAAAAAAEASAAPETPDGELVSCVPAPAAGSIVLFLWRAMDWQPPRLFSCVRRSFVYIKALRY